MDQKDLLAKLVSAIEDAVIVVDEGGKIISFNSGASNIFGYAAEDALGRPLDILLPDAIRAGHPAHIEAFAKQGDGTRRMGERGRIQGRRKDGSVFPAEASIVTVKDGDKRYFAAILRDISRRVASRLLREGEARKFNLLFNASNQFCALLDADGKVVEINRTWLDFLRLDLVALQGKTFSSLPFWDGGGESRQTVATSTNSALSGQFVALELDIVGSGDVRKSILLSLKPVVVENKVRYVIVNGADITTLQKTNDALRHATHRLARAQKIARMGYWDWRITENDLFWSDDVYSIFGLERTNFGANYESFLAVVHPDDLQYVQDSVNAALRGEEEYSIDHRIILSSGEIRHVHEQAETVFDETGRAIRMDGIIQDITDRKLQELGLRLAIEQAEAASRAKTNFLANMSHELRTPLNAIIGFSEILEKQSGDPEKLDAARIGEYSGYIQKSGQHLLSIISDVLDLARIETGNLELHEGDHDIHALVRRALRFVQEQAVGKGTVISVDIPSAVCKMRVDERLIVQVLVNLLANAIKFTPNHGSIDVKTWPGPDGKMNILVSDTGIGIAPEDISRIMQPFEQVASALTRQEEGAGLGLPLVREFIALHGGTFALESEPGKGTRATITLPASRLIAQPRSAAARMREKAPD